LISIPTALRVDYFDLEIAVGEYLKA